MRKLGSTFKFTALLFSTLAVAACGQSGQVTPQASTVQAQQKNLESYETPDTVPLHDIGWEAYDHSIQAQATIDVSTTSTPDANKSEGEVATPKDSLDAQNASSATETSTTPAPVAAPPEAPIVERKVVPMKVVETGTLKPTVYYFPVYDEDKDKCDKNEVRTLHGVNGEKIINVCPNTLAACGLQGSCAVIQRGLRRSFNISDRIKGQDRFFEMTDKECPYGYGVRNSCLDPFYTLAADLTIYQPGDVIFVPAVVGLKLPDGTTHDGYFVVRDQGRGINGKGRFDFYSGFLNWNDSRNPFRKLGLSDVNTHVPYSKITGERAQLILKSRGYPKLPLKN